MMELIGYIGKETLNMAITYNEATQIFTLQTAGSTYQMMVGRYNILQHLYYGRKVEGSTMDYLLWSSDSGFSGNPYEAGSDRTFSLDIQPQEYPSAGVGDYRTSCIEVVNPDGTRAADFRYVSHEITAGAYKVTGMPAVYDENGESSTLTILMKDAATGLELVLKYGVFEKDHFSGKNAVRMPGHGLRGVGDDPFPRQTCHGTPDGAHASLPWHRFRGKQERNLQPSP